MVVTVIDVAMVVVVVVGIALSSVVVDDWEIIPEVDGMCLLLCAANTIVGEGLFE